MTPKYRAEADSFIIENYNAASPFSSFFPALAGEAGKPMWLFYTNRGQGVASFSINSKDGAMLEFLPANKAYQATPFVGFRTFLRSKATQGWFEPFTTETSGPHQLMVIRPYELEFIDRDAARKLETSVVCYGVPNEAHPLIARALTVTNLSNHPMQLQIVDGLPRVVPYGM